MFSITEKDGTIFSADSAENTVELYRAFHSEWNDDGWITWSGGECPVADSLVEFRMRNGVYLVSYAKSLRWSHLYYPGDIVAYKVVENA